MWVQYFIVVNIILNSTWLLVASLLFVKLMISHVERAEDKFAWLRDDEFARQAIAGVNPVSIEKLKVFPPVSKLDPQIYGPQESALKEEHILSQLDGMTVQEVASILLTVLITNHAFVHSALLNIRVQILGRIFLVLSSVED